MSSGMTISPATTSRAVAQLRLMGKVRKATRPILRSAEEAERHLARLLTKPGWLISTRTRPGTSNPDRGDRRARPGRLAWRLFLQGGRVDEATAMTLRAAAARDLALGLGMALASKRGPVRFADADIPPPGRPGQQRGGGTLAG